MSIKIINGKKGYHLKVNNLFISHGFGPDIKTIENKNGVPYGATEWVSIEAIKKFWAKYRPLIIAATARPCLSEWGKLEFIENYPRVKK